VTYLLADVDFTLRQEFAAPVDTVEGALVNPELLTRMAELPKLGSAEVVRNERDGDIVKLQVRYLFQADLSASVTRVVDPSKLTWIEDSTVDLGAHHTTCLLRPDNYANLLEGGYEATIAAAGAGCVRTVTGHIKVHVPLLGSKVERAIVGGLSENSDAQTLLISEFLGL
jgi:hypothetical protein